VLRYESFAILCSFEMIESFEETGLASLLTTHPLPLPLTQHTNTQSQSQSHSTSKSPHSLSISPAPSSGCEIVRLPLFSKAVYFRWIRAYPIFAGRGDAFLKNIDTFVNETYFVFLKRWFQATRFDILGFAKHYLAILFFGYELNSLSSVSSFSPLDLSTTEDTIIKSFRHLVALESLSSSSSFHSTRKSDVDRVASQLQPGPDSSDEEDQFYDAQEGSSTELLNASDKSSTITSNISINQIKSTIIQNLALKPYTHQRGRFRTLPHSSNPLFNVLLASRDPLQEYRYKRFSSTWCASLASLRVFLLSVQPRLEHRQNHPLRKGFGEAALHTCKAAKTLQELPVMYRVLCERLVEALACLYENILDDVKWSKVYYYIIHSYLYSFINLIFFRAKV
jgi:hypothetical protein